MRIDQARNGAKVGRDGRRLPHGAVDLKSAPEHLRHVEQLFHRQNAARASARNHAAHVFKRLHGVVAAIVKQALRLRRFFEHFFHDAALRARRQRFQNLASGRGARVFTKHRVNARPVDVFSFAENLHGFPFRKNIEKYGVIRIKSERKSISEHSRPMPADVSNYKIAACF